MSEEDTQSVLRRACEGAPSRDAYISGEAVSRLGEEHVIKCQLMFTGN